MSNWETVADRVIDSDKNASSGTLPSLLPFVLVFMLHMLCFKLVPSWLSQEKQFKKQ